ncbi:HNH endonuclease signature motif containing protein [Brevibacillus laterosporus]|uniref:HNH endonuclease signature motif containing protein n=1 Tax=Brevibacillus laterosporus TaxID=1465 RepID=UPI000E6D410F|nr:HNH endonuclease signature motif containing protein [Brevibacillus laterosporus]AYB37431.1 HNH endonuclease [Brevibacillus laterosporus]MBM7109990.1 HNH endonuclease [Brevibacillus laterosporus]NKQ20725.1 HNH endonuclease [Brevibacillus laterosporus]WNX29668.1 HNH endonuclease signature motif containing protein [Brevibacillus laterosporus]
MHQKKQVQQYDRERGSATQRGYDAKWRKARIGFLRKHSFCKHCFDKGFLTGATVVDHIIPQKGDKTLFWYRNNWQPICEQCHNRKTAREIEALGDNLSIYSRHDLYDGRCLVK